MLEASVQNGNSNLLKPFHSDIQDGSINSRLETLQTTFPLDQYVVLARNVVGGIGWHGG